MQSVKGMQLAISLANCPVCDLTLILVFRPAKELSFFILCLPFFPILPIQILSMAKDMA